MDDKTLIKEIQNGKKEYLNDIAERYYDDIYRFCCYQSGSALDAYDLAQETFLKFIRYIDGYRYKNLKGYLLTIAMNVCRDYYHKPEKKYAVDIAAPDMDKISGLKQRNTAGGEEHRKQNTADGSA